MVFVIVAAVLAAFGLVYYLFPDATRRWFNIVATVRQVIWGVFLLSFAFVLISAGTAGMAIAGSLILGYAVLYVVFEEPLDPVRDVIGL